MRLKKSTGRKRSARVYKFLHLTRLKEFARLPMKTRLGVMVVVVLCFTVAAMLIAGHEPSPPAGVDTRPEKGARIGTRTAAAPLGAVDGTSATSSATESAAKAAVAKAAPVTITGCLERDDATFRLKDTEGANAPKSRSWKKAFLKKDSTSIEVVDAAHRLKLPDHVGERISVTGTLVDREMQVRSLQRVAASCTNSSRVKI